MVDLRSTILRHLNSTISSSRELCLVQKRQLVLPLNDFCRGLSDEALERSGEVRLIEIASLVDGVDDRDALLQQSGCIAGPFNLTKGGVGYTGGPQKMPLCG